MSADDRYVLLGLARPRASWFADVSRWATAATIPAEFVKCVSSEELRARLSSGRAWSAALLDGALGAVDRDLLGVLRDAGCAAIVVDDRGDGDRWRSLGAAGQLPSGFDRRQLLELLEAAAQPIGRLSSVDGAPATVDENGRGVVVTVCGPGGTGASTVAAAVAQGFARAGADVVLADLALRAEQAALHDVRDVVPGVQELVEAHRAGALEADEVRRLTFDVVDRGYALLLGLRQARYWPTLRPHAFSAAFGSLQSAFDVVVCDVTADFEGEADTGSTDVEERNIAARTSLARADAVLAVGRPGVKGVHALVRVLTDLVAADAPADRIIPVVALAPRSPRARAEIVSALELLLRPALGRSLSTSPVFLPTRPVEQALRDGTRLPAPLSSRLHGAVSAVLDRAGRRVARRDEPVPVEPGSLGTFTDGAG